jgi:hypothetical protein
MTPAGGFGMRTAVLVETAMLRATLIGLILFAAAPALAQDRPRGPLVAPEFRLHGEEVSLPIVMVREFPFVEAQVNGVKGKLMLDTGDNSALGLNDNHLTLPDGRTVGQGQFGSGQTFKLILRPLVDQVRLPGGLAYGPITTVMSQSATQLEHITPDFLGWLGYWFWDGYAMKLDYKAARVTFYKGGPKAFLKGEKVIAALPFTLPKLPNQPVIRVRIGGVEFQTVFDTGQYGNLYTDAATLKHLTVIGAVRPAAGEHHPADVRLQLPGGLNVRVEKLATHPSEEAAPFAKPIGLDASPHILSLGYGFLKQYKTVWDYPGRTLYLLKR